MSSSISSDFITEMSQELNWHLYQESFVEWFLQNTVKYWRQLKETLTQFYLDVMALIVNVSRYLKDYTSFICTPLNSLLCSPWLFWCWRSVCPRGPYLTRHHIDVVGKVEVTEQPPSDEHGGMMVLACIPHDFVQVDAKLQSWHPPFVGKSKPTWLLKN